VDAKYEEWEKETSRAVGGELRRAREARGWSRGQSAVLLPSGIGERTLLSYEHGTRHLTVVRYIELCRAMGVSPVKLLAQALQRARVNLENISLRIHLRALLADKDDTFRSLAPWARNALHEHPDGVVELEPAVVRNLALFIGCQHLSLIKHLARFIPDDGGG
jgi:transcriptional regulator with XRE-family HTH domain